MSTIIVAGPPPGDTEEARILTVGETVVFCGPPGEGCFESPLAGGAGIAEGILGPLVSAFLITSAPEGNPGFELDTSSVEIAGRTGVCFTFAPETIVGSDTEYVRQCVDAELGFTLLTEVRESGATEADRVMELLEYGPPLPEDFSPTGPVTELPES